MDKLTKEEAKKSLIDTTKGSDKIIFIILGQSTGKARMKMFVADGSLMWETTFALSQYFQCKFDSTKLIATINSYNINEEIKKLISDINFYNYNVIEL